MMLYFAYGALVIAILNSFFSMDWQIKKARRISFIMTALALSLFYGAGQLHLFSLLALIGLLTVIYHYLPNASELLASTIKVAVVLLALVLALHQFPGLNNVLLHEQVQVSGNADAFDIYANFDKGLAAVFMLLMLTPVTHTKALPRSKLLIIPVSIALLLGIGVLTGLRWEPKWPVIAATFLAVNLLFTVISEEVFFRGWLQSTLVNMFIAHGYSRYWGLCIVAIIFGLAHLGGGLWFVLLATCAGLAYGLVYLLTKRLWTAVLLHFGLNAAHFLLLTYPVPSA